MMGYSVSIDSWSVNPKELSELKDWLFGLTENEKLELGSIRSTFHPQLASSANHEIFCVMCDWVEDHGGKRWYATALKPIPVNT